MFIVLIECAIVYSSVLQVQTSCTIIQTVISKPKVKIKTSEFVLTDN